MQRSSGKSRGTDQLRQGPFAALKNMRLSVVVPVYNEVANIAKNLDLLIAEVSPYFDEFEILVVSDGSTDGTNEALKEFQHPKVKLILYELNRGKGFALREGFKAAAGDFVFFIDGGMELHPKEIRVFLGLLAIYNADVVVGSKRHPQSRIDYPRSRRLLSFIYQMLVRRLFKVDVTDTQVGLKLFRSEVIKAILPHLKIDRYGADLEMLALARRFGFKRFLEAPIRLDYFRNYSRTRVGEITHIFAVGYSVLRDTLRIYQQIRHLPAANVQGEDSAKDDSLAA